MLKRLGLLFFAVSLLISCGKEKGGIEFDRTVPTYQKNLLVGDLALIQSLNFTNPASYELSIMGLTELTPNSLAGFISQRTRYIVGESYDYNRLASLSSSLGLTDFLGLSAASNVVTVMTNVGGAVYLVGKSTNTTYSLPVAGDDVSVNSPRVGIIKVGPGLFNNSKTNKFSPESYASRLMRLGTLFHEARHSDGNGENAAFPHAMCESGDFEGHYACEANTNGPYMVQAVMLNNFFQFCRTNNCSWNELSALQLAAADAASRLQRGSSFQDPAPERLR